MIEKIENIICVGEGFTPDEIHVKSRETAIKETRQIIMYFAKSKTRMTWKAIADYFDMNEHSTVISACKRINDLIYTDESFKAKIEKYNKRIKAIELDKMAEYALSKLAGLELELAEHEKNILNIKDLVKEIHLELKIVSDQITKNLK
jgi:hypothetical protein